MLYLIFDTKEEADILDATICAGEGIGIGITKKYCVIRPTANNKFAVNYDSVVAKYSSLTPVELNDEYFAA